LGRALEHLDGVQDVALASDSVRQGELWRLREAHTEAIATLGVVHKLDVSLPLARLAGFIDEVPGRVAAVDPAATTYLFGHLGDGNIHVNVAGAAPDDEGIDGAVFDLVASMGGSISAEHGIGTAKRSWLSLNRSPEELVLFRALKGACDPDAILNPRVLLPPA
jgi:FAD/FMN-containing dehydrogenase